MISLHNYACAYYAYVCDDHSHLDGTFVLTPYADGVDALYRDHPLSCEMNLCQIRLI